MKSSLLACAALVVASGAAFAQSAPLRGFGLLALESSSSPRNFGGAGSAGHAMLETPDDSGGPTRAHAVRGGDIGPPVQRDADAGMNPDAIPPHAMVPIDPALPATTPKHPSYRWQALVPGALK